jgi:hypothetical protein
MTTLRTAQKRKDWSYDVMTDSYRHISGVTVDRIDIARNNGDLETVLDNALKMASVGAAGAVGAPYNPSIVYNGEPFDVDVSSGSAMITSSIQNDQPRHITIQTSLGDIALNLKTGDIAIPVGVGRDDAIREFWLGFQKNFQPLEKKSYEDKILTLERELAKAKTSATLMRAENQKEASKRVAEKIAKKYANEKFIMVKPADLIKFIEEE